MGRSVVPPSKAEDSGLAAAEQATGVKLAGPRRYFFHVYRWGKVNPDPGDMRIVFVDMLEQAFAYVSGNTVLIQRRRWGMARRLSRCRRSRRRRRPGRQRRRDRLRDARPERHPVRARAARPRPTWRDFASGRRAVARAAGNRRSAGRRRRRAPSRHLDRVGRPAPLRSLRQRRERTLERDSVLAGGFRCLLLERAREVGVDVRQPCAVTGHADARQHEASRQRRARSPRGWSSTRRARRAGSAAPSEVDSPARSPRLIARYGYMEGSCPAYDDAPSLGRRRVRLDMDGAGAPRTLPMDARFLRRSAALRLDAAASLRARRRARSPRRRRHVADGRQGGGPDWFMVGDAAATLDPTSSHGVLKAIISGMTAGHLIAAVLRDRAPAEEAAAAYHDWCAGWFSADAARLSEFYRKLGVAGFT